jgi:hypothetical protein
MRPTTGGEAPAVAPANLACVRRVAGCTVFSVAPEQALGPLGKRLGR